MSDTREELKKQMDLVKADMHEADQAKRNADARWLMLAQKHRDLYDRMKALEKKP